MSCIIRLNLIWPSVDIKPRIFLKNNFTDYFFYNFNCPQYNKKLFIEGKLVICQRSFDTYLLSCEVNKFRNVAFYEYFTVLRFFRVSHTTEYLKLDCLYWVGNYEKGEAILWNVQGMIHYSSNPRRNYTGDVLLS